MMPPVARTLWLAGLVLGCGQNAASGTKTTLGAGGLLLNLPDSSANSCGGASAAFGDAGVDPECGTSRAPVSFARDVAPIFTSCAGEVCHANWTYDEMVGVHSAVCCDKRLLVAPNEPSLSALVQALRGTNDCVGAMPPSAPLPQESIDTVTAWVCQGAPRN
jgi:hypothetical protein